MIKISICSHSFSNIRFPNAFCGTIPPLNFLLFQSTNRHVQKTKQELENNKLNKRLRHAVGDAINDFNMIEPGDKIMVCLSGGKDSYALLDILRQLQASAPIDFELVAVNLDQKQPGFPEEVLPTYLESIGVPYKIVEEDTYSTVKRVLDEGKTTCSLCSRLRRGILYRTAKELGCTKIALGHHRDDILATMFLNMFYGGKLKAMPPKLVSDNGEHIVIRPLAYVKEKDLIKYAELKQFPIIPCNLCGSQPNLQRQVIGDMLRDWDKRFPGRIESMFSALQNVVPSHLADPELFDFVGLERGQTLKHGGDLAFDSEKMPERYSDGSEEDESEIKITPSKPERKVINILANKPKTCGL
ncbi:PP-loop family protein [Neisseria macacae ATCC 33926]|uniref:tRNA-cytidine(32) 2-sulfurtransferase n=1 Tax=Neisseria macacae ATCC 33926 TaxID=997348 RepID=A0AA36XKN9_9NEIS|nr:PP-loop family protein [Neisseria macacae ATCC 33926]